MRSDPHDWNPPRRLRVSLQDETLREGLQAPGAYDPPLHAKIEILRALDRHRVGAVSVGYPASSARAFEDAAGLLRVIVQEKLDVCPVAAARTDASDVETVARVVQRAGRQVDVYAFLGASLLREKAEGWNSASRLTRIELVAELCQRELLPWCLVVEDAVRTSPAVLQELFECASSHGAKRLCLCDTAGYATPSGTQLLVEWTLRWRERAQLDIAIDWHGHDDRGLAMANALAAISAGVDRVHGTVLGLGERVGNAPLEQLLLHLELEGSDVGELAMVNETCHLVAEAFRLEIPARAPICGRDAFTTSAGVHASAVSKALRAGDHNLAECVYGGVAPSRVGRKLSIALGHVGGAASARHWLLQHELPPHDECVEALVAFVKSQRHTPTDDELLDALARRSAKNR